MTDTSLIDAERRFGGLARLYGPQGLARLGQAHVAVAGIGGVGSWCAEALARSGVGALTLIDMDHIAESNVNRQLHALTSTLGQSKVLAMSERIRGINPGCRVNMIDDFVSAGNVHDILAPDLSLLIDCTDQVSAKIAMILQARESSLPIVVCGGAGGKTNPLSLRASDLSLALNDALLAKLRNTLRRHHGFPKASDAAGKPRKRVPKMGIRSVWFDQPALLPAQWDSPDPDPEIQGAASAVPAAQPVVQPTGTLAGAAAGLQGLSCAGYGSAVTVTAAMGMGAAHEAMHWLLHCRFQP